MTQSQLERRVAYWQKRLGLTHWKITAHIGDVPGNNVACIEPADQYDRAHLYVNFDAIKSDANINNDYIIVHELLHLAFRDIDQAYRSIRSGLAPVVWEVYEYQMEHEIEGVVDRMAALLSKI